MRAPSVLLDTHVLLWILAESKQLRRVPWLTRFPVWTVSPVSFLEIKFLQECGRIQLELVAIIDAIRHDERFVIDNPDLEVVCTAALNVEWTRDPFDRLLAAHSLVRSMPFGTCDTLIRTHHRPIV